MSDKSEGVAAPEPVRLASIVMSVRPLVPGLESDLAALVFESRSNRDAALLVGLLKVLVLKRVGKASVGGVGEGRAEIDPIDARPVDGAHAHRARGAVHVDL